jgi:hypothetical protein
LPLLGDILVSVKPVSHVVVGNRTSKLGDASAHRTQPADGSPNSGPQ